MKWLPLLWAGLWRKPARAILTLLSIVVAFVMVGTMSGINTGLAELLGRARLDRIYVGPRFFGSMPAADLEQIARLPGVIQLAPEGMVGGFYREPKNAFGIRMTDERMAGIQPEWHITPALYREMKQNRTGVIINQVVADRFALKVGDRFPLQTTLAKADGSKVWIFDVLAIVPPSAFNPNGMIAVGNYAYLDEARAGQKGSVRDIQFLIKDPARAVQTSEAVEALFVNSSVPLTAVPEQMAVAASLKGLIDMNFFTHAVTAAALFMILFLTGNVMAQSVHERTAEFAVMKTIGMADGRIFVLVLAEALIPYLIGAGFGLALSEAVPVLSRQLLGHLGVPLPVMTFGVIASGLALAVFAAVAGGMPAAWRMKQLSIVDALAGR